MTNTKDKLNLWVNPNSPTPVQRTLTHIIKAVFTQEENPGAVAHKRIKEAMQRSGADLDLFDFYRGGEERGQTTCPSCSERADLRREEPGVLLVCTKCSFDAYWRCAFETTTLGGRGSIHLVHVDDPDQMPDEEIPF